MRLATLSLVLLAFVSGACSKRETDEQKIQKVLDAGVAALEARDSAKAAELLSDDYMDARGRTRDKLKGLAFFALQQGPVLVRLTNVTITVKGDNATVPLKALAVQGSGQLKSAMDLLPTNARAFDLTVKLAKEGGDWMVTAIDGDGFGGGMD